MARYGRDYSSDRFANRHPNDFGYRYDSDFGRGQGDRAGWYSDRSFGFEDPYRSRHPGSNRWGGYNDRDDAWRSTGRDRWRFDGDTWGGGFEAFDGYGQGRRSNLGATNRGYFDRQGYGYRGQMGNDYDDDFRDRIRRGWDRFRNEAREWLGRGYDRGW